MRTIDLKKKNDERDLEQYIWQAQDHKNKKRPRCQIPFEFEKQTQSH